VPTFKVTLAYDGTDYVGWQRQARGVSIQALVEDAVGELDQRPVAVTGAGRTDAGVHAEGQVASFSIRRTIGPRALVRALNARLPRDVRVLAAEEMPATFHPRFQARAKTYRYRIWNGDVLSPFEYRYAWHVVDVLDVGAMALAARALEGRHDFAAFRASGSRTRSNEREIFSSRISSPEVSTPCDRGRAVLQAGAFAGGRIIVYEISGNGFLRHMVRNIVGTLVEVGSLRRAPECVSEVLASRDRTEAGPTAPAAGLVLVSVEYGGVLAADS
jgi:tRNA pseudouridine38-40 synthase